FSVRCPNCLACSALGVLRQCSERSELRTTRSFRAVECTAAHEPGKCYAPAPPKTFARGRKLPSFAQNFSPPPPDGLPEPCTASVSVFAERNGTTKRGQVNDSHSGQSLCRCAEYSTRITHH